MAESRFFKHGTMIRFTIRSGDEVLEERDMPLENLGGALTVAGFTYNALTMSGGVAWRHPRTGYPIKPKWSWELVDPTDELFDGAFCDCADCSLLSEEAS